ncbi:MAG: hypothetical protein OEU32_13410, partial [Acidimicrobiia bacterium]|nr:hypothetical protein [Acidimicrobiia bacterium]
SRLLVHKRGGVTALVVGLLAMYAVRPHVAILLVAAVAVGVIINALFRSGDGVRSFGFASKMGSVVLLVVLASLLAPRVATFLNVDDVGGSGFSSALESVQARTDEGGSNFDAADIDSIVDYPWAFITVIFRPFPWEVTNAQSAVTALEGLVLAGLLFFSIRRLARLPVEAIKRPYAAAAAAYVFMFCYVFAFVGNFGILARQRSQLLPFVFVLVALPLTERARTRARPGPYPRDGGGSDDGPSAEGGETDRPSGESARARQSGLNIVTAGIGPPSRRR